MNHTTSLWWDTECSILNSRNEHFYSISPNVSSLEYLGLNKNEEYFLFTLLQSDINGNLPISPIVLGQAKLPMLILELALKKRSFHEKIMLPIICNNCDSGKQMSLWLTHREIPGIISRVSLDYEKIRNNNNNRDNIDKDNDKNNNNELIDKSNILLKENESSLQIEIDRILHLIDFPSIHSDHEIYILSYLDNLEVGLISLMFFINYITLY